MKDAYPDDSEQLDLISFLIDDGSLVSYLYSRENFPHFESPMDYLITAEAEVKMAMSKLGRV